MKYGLAAFFMQKMEGIFMATKNTIKTPLPLYFTTINEQISKNAQSYPTNSKTSSSVAPFLMN